MWSAVLCFGAFASLLLLLLQLSFVAGRPTEWNLISEMGTCRESSAACFSLTKVIEAPEPPAANAADMFKKKAGKGDMAENPLHDGEDDEPGGSGDMENPLHDGEDDGDMENPLHDEKQDDDEEEL